MFVFILKTKSCNKLDMRCRVEVFLFLTMISMLFTT